MKIRIKEIRDDNRSHSKLACVKRIKELTGMGLKEAKETVDGCMYEVVEIEIHASRGDIERMKDEFETWGYEISGGRDEAIDDLLGDGFKYTIEYLHRDVTYRVEEGDYTVVDGMYVINIEIGTKLDDHGEKSCNGRKIIIPREAVVIEENIMMNEGTVTLEQEFNML